MKTILLLAALLCAACDSSAPQCWEKACKPTWAGDCTCPPGTTMETGNDGTVYCRCPKK